MTVLVTGGAGYIGSHTTYALLDRGDEVVVLDNLSTGIRSQVGAKAAFVQGEVADQALVARVDPRTRNRCRHSFRRFYRRAGLGGQAACLLRQQRRGLARADRGLREGRLEQFIFSSTATVFAEDAAQPLAEDTPNADSPYARSKLMTEWMLEDTSRAYDFRHVVLRYFNVAGADPKAARGNPRQRRPTSSNGPAKWRWAAWIT